MRCSTVALKRQNSKRSGVKKLVRLAREVSVNSPSCAILLKSTGQRTRRSASHSFYNHDLPSHLGGGRPPLPRHLHSLADGIQQQRAKRMRKAGHTYKTIASRLSISSTTARRYALA